MTVTSSCSSGYTNLVEPERGIAWGSNLRGP